VNCAAERNIGHTARVACKQTNSGTPRLVTPFLGSVLITERPRTDLFPRFCGPRPLNRNRVRTCVLSPGKLCELKPRVTRRLRGSKSRASLALGIGSRLRGACLMSPGQLHHHELRLHGMVPVRLGCSTRVECALFSCRAPTLKLLQASSRAPWPFEHPGCSDRAPVSRRLGSPESARGRVSRQTSPQTGQKV
jgi:hypothetical protein